MTATELKKIIKSINKLYPLIVTETFESLRNYDWYGLNRFKREDEIIKKERFMSKTNISCVK